MTVLKHEQYSIWPITVDVTLVLVRGELLVVRRETVDLGAVKIVETHLLRV